MGAAGPGPGLPCRVAAGVGRTGTDVGAGLGPRRGDLDLHPGHGDRAVTLPGAPARGRPRPGRAGRGARRAAGSGQRAGQPPRIRTPGRTPNSAAGTASPAGYLMRWAGCGSAQAGSRAWPLIATRQRSTCARPSTGRTGPSWPSAWRGWGGHRPHRADVDEPAGPSGSGTWTPPRCCPTRGRNAADGWPSRTWGSGPFAPARDCPLHRPRGWSRRGTPGKLNGTGAARLTSGPATPTTRSGHADDNPGATAPPGQFRKLDAVAVMTGPLLPAPH
jgi:hypothetical protein